jgi:hypothetical protein
MLTYKIKDEHSVDAISMEPRTGRLILADPTLFKPGTITIEAQDNAIPLSTRELQCRLILE